MAQADIATITTHWTRRQSRINTHFPTSTSYSSNSKVQRCFPSLTSEWVIIRFAFVNKISPRQHSEQAMVLMNILSCLSTLSTLLQHSLAWWTSSSTLTQIFYNRSKAKDAFWVSRCGSCSVVSHFKIVLFTEAHPMVPSSLLHTESKVQVLFQGIPSFNTPCFHRYGQKSWCSLSFPSCFPATCSFCWRSTLVILPSIMESSEQGDLSKSSCLIRGEVFRHVLLKMTLPLQRPLLNVTTGVSIPCTISAYEQ